MNDEELQALGTKYFAIPAGRITREEARIAMLLKEVDRLRKQNTKLQAQVADLLKRVEKIEDDHYYPIG